MTVRFYYLAKEFARESGVRRIAPYVGTMLLLIYQVTLRMTQPNLRS